MPEKDDHVYGFSTRSAARRTSADSASNARAVPIYQTTSYVFETPNIAGRSVNLQTFGTSTPAS